MFKKIKKSVAVFAVLLLMSSSLSANVVAFADCYDEAFDAMEDMDDLGAPPSVVKAAGEWAYCYCEPSCEWPSE